jgi:ankyrin repeat protein
LVAQFYNAARSGNENTVHKLLADGVKPDFKDCRNVSLLWIAATNGHYKVVQVLLATEHVEVNSKSEAGRSPIFRAAARGHKGIVELLLRAEANFGFIDEDGNTPLSIAKKYRFHEMERIMAGQ